MSSRPPRLPDVLMRSAVIVGVMVIALGAAQGPSWSIKSDEQVMLFPTDARRSADGGGWVLPIHGWIYEPESDGALRKLVVAGLRQVIGTDANATHAAVFQQRIAWFLVDNERNKVIRVRIGDDTHALPPSLPNGHFEGEIAIGDEQLKALTHGADHVDIAVVFDDPARAPVRSRVRVLEDDGVSVISDIDDTIKHSHVLDKKELVKNTFIRPFRATPGMVEMYRRWADEGVRFHYVSSSPWQLFPALDAFTRDAGFPDASFALKNFRLQDAGILDLFADPLETKPPAIERILAQGPRRRICLVGDDGEKDPEVYGAVARAHPDRVHVIYIRNVSGSQRSDSRFATAFRDVPDERWHLFVEPTGLPACR